LAEDIWLAGVAEHTQAQLTDYGDPVVANALAIAAAARDADIPMAEIDGVFTYDSLVKPDILQAGRVAEYCGVSPGVAATVGAAGATPTTALVLAASLIASGQANCVAIAHSDLRNTAGRDSVIARMAANVGNLEFEAPFGPILPTMYSLLADWLIGTGRATREDYAEIAVATRKWAALNPTAAKTSPLTVEDVLNAPPVAGVLGRYDCCLVTDFGGAVLVSGRRPSGGRPGVRLRGTGAWATHEELLQMNPANPLEAAEKAGRIAYERAAVGPADLDMAFLYDSFTSTVAQQLVAYDLVGEVGLGALLRDVGIGPGGGFPVNTHGGLLSGTTSGIFHLVEAIRQLRGDAGPRQLGSARLALVANIGGLFSNHCAAILEAVR
jgi:acetyl-CoA acetyltransferase